MSTGKKGKIIAIAGTTASGKTALGVRLAQKFNGEIVSADSRQVYKGMDIGTGKDLAEYAAKLKDGQTIKIPYHLIDVVEPNQDFSLAQFLELVHKAIGNILARRRLPIVVGGTGLWVQALVDGFVLPPVKPNLKLRQSLEKLPTPDLLAKLQAQNPQFVKKLSPSDKQNKRRLIRYLEILSVRPTEPPPQPRPKYQALVLGITWPRPELKKRIYARLLERLEKEDMIGEVERLHKAGVSWQRLKNFGLEYKWLSLYLTDEIDYETMVEKLSQAIFNFAKRQMTWLRRWQKQGAKIHWLSDEKEAERLVADFLNEVK